MTRRIIAKLQRAGTGALAGLLAIAAALGVALLVSGLAGPDTDPVVAVGGAAINLTPVPVKDFAIQHFGSHDKDVLVIGILAVLAGLAIVVGLVSLRRIWYGLLGLAGFALVGIAAAVTRRRPAWWRPHPSWPARSSASPLWCCC